jgi:ribonuclease E
MAKRMLIDAAHPEETRVVVLNGHRLEEFDFETSTKKQIKGNIYLAKVTRVEPSLQAAFVEYGGNRHGFLAFGEIHPDYYRIPVADRRAALDADREAEAAADEREERHVEGGENGVIEPPHEHHDIEQPDFEPHDHLEADDHEHDDHDHDHGHDHDHDIGHLAERSTAEILRDADVHEHAEETDDRFAEPSASAPYEGAPSDTMAPSAEPEFPVGDAFAEDDAVQSGEALASEQGDAAAMPSGELAPSEDGDPHLETAAPAAPLETVGGDEIEETTRRRARPHRHYKIQEVIKRRQIMLVQVTKEERGNKGAALTTYISLAGRYCVLMPNTPRGGGVSRKITSMQDRRRLKELMDDLEVPEGMGVIVRTAGSERSKVEIKRDFEYLIRLWDEIRELTLRSTAPALIYEEGNLIKRTIRDLYARDIDEVLVDGKEGYETAKSFMRMLMPTHSKRVKFYNDPSVPLFHRFQVEGQLDAIHSPVVQLRSGGYIVINPT